MQKVAAYLREYLCFEDTLRGRLNRDSWASFVREFLGNSPAVLTKTLGRLNRRVTNARLTSILLPLFIPENSLSLPATKIDL
jgi:hypothetical protein